MTNTNEKVDWTTYEPERCICVGAKVGQINVRGGMKPVFILDLVAEVNGRQIIKFFNAQKTKAGNYTVSRKSNFAKLYRITVGENPSARFSRANQLLGHLLGKEFIVEYRAVTSTTSYYKAENIKPVEPIITDQWFPSGILKPNIKVRHNEKLLAKERQLIDKDLAINGQKDDNLLTIVSGHESATEQGLGTDSNPIQNTTKIMKPLPHTTVEKINDKEMVYCYKRNKDETDEDYDERVIRESFMQ